MLKPNHHKLTRIVLIISIISFHLGLLAFAYMGSFMRLIGDDYFLAANYKAYGFCGAQQHAYLNHVYFHGNRVGQTFILTVFSVFPPIISAVLPFLTIVVFIATIYFFLSTLLAQLNLAYAPILRLSFSLIVAFFTLFLAPSITQGLYWRSSMVSSFGTNIGAFLLGALILWKKPLKWFWFPLILVYAFFNAALSENGAAYQGVLLGLLIVFAFYLKIKGSEFFPRIISLSSIALLAILAAIVVMWRSPGIAIFKREISNSLPDAIILSFYHMVNFYKEMLLSKTFDLILLLLLGFFTFFISHPANNASHSSKLAKPLFWLGQIVLIQLINIGFILAIMLPSAYTRNAYPDPRHFMGAVLAFVFAYLLTGFYSGAFIQSCCINNKILSKIPIYTLSLVAFLLIAVIYPLLAIPQITAERLKFCYWATQWDQRHTQIVQAARDGDPVIHVLEMDHIIENVSELTPNPNSPTYNEPASIYYGILIIADQPGWDEGFTQFRQSNLWCNW